MHTMKKILYITSLLLVGLSSCKDDDIAVFDQTADERNAEAIADLKADLVAPANGWRIKYTPEDGFGSYYVLMNFTEDNTVRIRTDLGVEDGTYFDQTITYRIDSSLGLELVLENYSFFAFLFEQDRATFGAEFEFLFVNKTSDDALVFRSKSDITFPGTILLFEAADADDEQLLGTEVSTNLNELKGDLDFITTSYKLTYNTKDLAFFVSMNPFLRVIDFTAVARKSDPSSSTALNFGTPYTIKGDSVVFDERFITNAFSNSINIKGFKLNSLSDGSIDVCANPIAVKLYAGVTSAGDAITLEPSLLDGNGSRFGSVTDFFVADPNNVIRDGESLGDALTEDIEGIVAVQLYYNYNLGGSPFYAMGFYLNNADGTTTFALRQFTSTRVGNNLQITFATDISIFGSPTPANQDNMKLYLDQIAAGGTTYVLKYNDNLYEFYNPCSAFAILFQPVT